MVEQVMTDIEAIVVGWLTKRKIGFQFQTSLAGGFYESGGAVVDVILPEDQIAIRIMGLYWHEGVSKRGRDQIQRENLESMGYTVVDIWDSDLESPAQIEKTMTKAIQGIEISH